MDFRLYLTNSTSFECSNQRLRDEDINNLLDFLDQNSQITSLNFSFNKVGNPPIRSGSALIKKLLKLRFPKLTHLNLGWNNFSKEGMKEIANSIKNIHFGRLKYLNIENNKIEEGLEFLAKQDVAEYLTSLEFLNISKNGIDSKIFENFLKIFEMIELKNLKHLDCGCSYIGNSGAIEIANLLNNNKLPNLKYLNFKPSRIGKEGKEVLVSATKILKNFKLVV